jgi:putative SOS response-associated peptidase YedK
MTDLYAVTISPAAMCDLFEAERDHTGNLPPNYAAAPGSAVPVVRKDEDGERTMELMRWGLPRAQGGKPVAAIQTIDDPRWPDLVKPAHRCLIPANAFSEGDDHNWFARDESRTPFAFAGVWLPAEPDAGNARGLCAILVNGVNGLTATEGEQPMPVILTEDEWDEWLDGDNEEARAVLKPPAEELLTVVSTGEERDPPASRMGYQ